VAILRGNSSGANGLAVAMRRVHILSRSRIALANHPASAGSPARFTGHPEKSSGWAATDGEDFLRRVGVDAIVLVELACARLDV
jgi:hypothetical protein